MHREKRRAVKQTGDNMNTDIVEYSNVNSQGQEGRPVVTMEIFNTLADDNEGNEKTAHDDTAAQTLDGHKMADGVGEQTVSTAEIHHSTCIFRTQGTAATDALRTTNQDTRDA